jgi:hypothetical protein
MIRMTLWSYTILTDSASIPPGGSRCVNPACDDALTCVHARGITPLVPPEGGRRTRPFLDLG